MEEKLDIYMPVTWNYAFTSGVVLENTNIYPWV